MRSSATERGARRSFARLGATRLNWRGRRRHQIAFNLKKLLPRAPLYVSLLGCRPLHEEGRQQSVDQPDDYRAPTLAADYSRPRPLPLPLPIIERRRLFIARLTVAGLDHLLTRQHLWRRAGSLAARSCYRKPKRPGRCLMNTNSLALSIFKTNGLMVE